MPNARQELVRLLAEKSFRLGEFKLSSGGTSDYYVDCRTSTLDALGSRLTGEVFLEEIRARGWRPQAVGGLTMGADPIVVAVAVVSGEISGFLIRKSGKEHGTGQRIEGFREKGARVVIVDDVCTTGASTIQAIEAARDFGFEIVGVMCLVEREEARTAQRAGSGGNRALRFHLSGERCAAGTCAVESGCGACRHVGYIRRLRVVWTAGCNQCPQIPLRRPPGVTRVSSAGSTFRFSYSFAVNVRFVVPSTATYLDLEYESTNEQGLATNNQMIHTLEWTDAGVRFIDQTKLPTEEVYVTCKTHEQVADVIRNMVVRGAPAIGVAAAMGLALAVKNSKADTVGALKKDFDEACELIGKTRPTAVNLFWAIRRMQEKLERARIQPIGQIKRTVIEEAKRIHAEDIAANQAMGRHGATLMPSSGGVLTHCNAGGSPLPVTEQLSV